MMAIKLACQCIVVVLILIWIPCCQTVCEKRKQDEELVLTCVPDSSISITDVTHFKCKSGSCCQDTIHESDWRQELINCNGKPMCKLNAKSTCNVGWCSIVCSRYEEVCYDCLYNPISSTTQIHSSTTQIHSSTTQIHSSTTSPNDQLTTTKSIEPGVTNVSTAENEDTTIDASTTDKHESTSYKEREIEHKAHILTIVAPSIVGMLLLLVAIALLAVYLVRRRRKACTMEGNERQSDNDNHYSNAVFTKNSNDDSDKCTKVKLNIAVVEPMKSLENTYQNCNDPDFIKNDIYSSNIDAKANGQLPHEKSRPKSTKYQQESNTYINHHSLKSSTDDYLFESGVGNAVYALPDGEFNERDIQETNNKISIIDQNVYYEALENGTSLDDQSKQTTELTPIPQNKIIAADCENGQTPYYSTLEAVNPIDDKKTPSPRNETFVINGQIRETPYYTTHEDVSDDICEDPYYSTPATDVSPRSITLNGMHEE
ncbi:unnamed protein product, partial [Owenia fusiformis]